MSLECRECNISFDTPEALANHKKSFCVKSDWYDPDVMRRALEAEETGLAQGRSKELSLNEVKAYLKQRASGQVDSNDRVGGKTLASLRDKFQNDENLEEMHRLITEQRNQEKADQLRQLKIRQQKIRAQRNQDEREIRDLMRDLEKRKEVCVVFILSCFLPPIFAILRFSSNLLNTFACLSFALLSCE